jgi:hypothetical protein
MMTPLVRKALAALDAHDGETLAEIGRALDPNDTTTLYDDYGYLSGDPR